MQGQQPIHFAAKYNAVEAFENLIQLGANPIARDSQARTPFFVAASAGMHYIKGHSKSMSLRKSRKLTLPPPHVTHYNLTTGGEKGPIG